MSANFYLTPDNRPITCCRPTKHRAPLLPNGKILSLKLRRLSRELRKLRMNQPRVTLEEARAQAQRVMRASSAP